MKPQNIADQQGKPLPKSFQTTLRKLVRVGILKEEYDSAQKTETLYNMCSGAQTICSPLCGDLCAWITRENPIEYPFTRSDWDNARYTVNVCWPEVYYAIID